MLKKGTIEIKQKLSDIVATDVMYDDDLGLGIASSDWRSEFALRHLQRSGPDVKYTEKALFETRGGIITTSINPIIEQSSSKAIPRVIVGALGLSKAHFGLLTSQSELTPGGTGIDTKFSGSVDLDLSLGRAMCCDWLGSTTFITGTNSGVIAGYGLSKNSTGVPSRKIEQPCIKFVTPESAGQSTVVSSVSVYPFEDDTTFASTNAEYFHVWSTTTGKTPIISRRPLPGFGISNFCWSQHTTGVAAIAAESNSLLFVDVKVPRPLVGKIDSVHSRDITAIAWNNYIPHIIATGGADSCVNIWDLRYSARPVVKISKSYGEITSIAWDTTRSEMFVFGSKDATFSCCNLELKPHSVMFTYDAKNSVESAGFIRMENNTACYAITSNGRFITSIMDDSFYTSLIDNHSIYDRRNDKDIESKIYLRHIKKGFSSALLTAADYFKKNPKQALSILDLCEPMEFDEFNDFKSVGFKVPDKDSFYREIATISRRIPLGYFDLFNISLDDSLKSDIEQLRLAVEIETFVADNDVKSILDRHESICQSLQKERCRIDIRLLFRIVAAALTYDYKKTVSTIGLDYAKIFIKNRAFQLFIPIAKLLLYPTVFEINEMPPFLAMLENDSLIDSNDYDIINDDDDDFSSSRRAIKIDSNSDEKPKYAMSQLLSAPDIVLHQLNFLRDFTLIVWGPEGGNCTTKLVELMDTAPKPIIMPFSLSATYMHMLLRDSFFKEFFHHAYFMIGETSGYPSKKIFGKFAELGLREFEQFLNKKIISPKKGTREMINFEKALKGVLYFISNPSAIPVKVKQLFRSAFDNLNDHFDEAVSNAIKNPDTSVSIPGKEQAAIKSQRLLDIIKVVTDDPFIEESDELEQMKEKIFTLEETITKQLKKLSSKK